MNGRTTLNAAGIEESASSNMDTQVLGQATTLKPKDQVQISGSGFGTSICLSFHKRALAFASL
jgi:hypothetical protein